MENLKTLKNSRDYVKSLYQRRKNNEIENVYHEDERQDLITLFELVLAFDKVIKWYER